MKFLTQARYLRLGNLADEKSFVAGHEDWETALANYEKHLAQIRRHLPVGLRRLVKSVYLHDARVLDIWQDSVNHFTITLQPDSDKSHLVILRYKLTQPPIVKRETLPETVHSEPVAWLYDELDVARPNRSLARNGNGDGKILVHDILLSNGWEIRLRFRGVTVKRPVALLPHGTTAFGKQVAS